MEGLTNKIVCDFYKVLAARDAKMVPYLLAPDIDWWFHGPAAHKYNLMQVLTGICEFDLNDSYEPLVVASIGTIVVAEGYYIHENQKTFWANSFFTGIHGGDGSSEEDGRATSTIETIGFAAATATVPAKWVAKDTTPSLASTLIYPVTNITGVEPCGFNG
ncbi:senescence-associated protein 20, partial [Tanacetum coccineum]